MMNSFSYPFMGLHIHWAFSGLLVFGLVAGLLWLHKYSSKENFMKWVWITLLVGFLGMLLTSGMGFAGWREMMSDVSGMMGR